MVVLIVYDKGLSGNNFEISRSVLPPNVGGSFIVAAIGMPKSERRFSKKLRQMLKKQGATSVFISRQLEIMIPCVNDVVKALGLRIIMERDHSYKLVNHMLKRACDLCGVPIKERKVTIVDLNAELLSYELLLCASQNAKVLHLMTSKGRIADPLTERLMSETGLAVRTMSVSHFKSDVALILDCKEGYRGSARVSVNLTGENYMPLDGRMFRSMTLSLPPALPLPRQLSMLEKTTLIFEVADRDVTNSFKPYMLI